MILQFYACKYKTRDLKISWCQSNLNVTLVQFFFCKFQNFFCRCHSLMNRPCYNKLVQIMQYDNFQNLNRDFLFCESQFNVFWYCFKIAKQYIFTIWWNWIPSKVRKPQLFWNITLFNTWYYQKLVILIFSSVVTLI